MSESEEEEENQEGNTEETSLMQEEHPKNRAGTKRPRTTEKINQDEEESGGEGAKNKKFTKLFETNKRSLRSRGKSIIHLIVWPPFFYDHIFKQHSTKSPYFFSHQLVTFILKRLVILPRNLVSRRMFLW